MSNSEIIENLQIFFYNWSCVYDDKNYMARLLKNHAEKVKDYFNKLYETTRYSYNPMWNTDVTTETIVTDSEKSNFTQNSKNNVKSDDKNYNIPFDDDTEKIVDRNSGESQADNTANGNNDRVFTHSEKIIRTGNIGVTSSAQLIEGERSILLNMIDEYIDSFKKFFYLDFKMKGEVENEMQ